MSETKPETKKGLADRGIGQFHLRQSKSCNFIHNKENIVRSCKDINDNVFGLVLKGQTELLANSLKAFYYICGIKFQNNGSDGQYLVNNILKPTLSAPTEPPFETGKTALNMVQKGILDAKIKKFVDREKYLEENLKRAF